MLMAAPIDKAEVYAKFRLASWKEKRYIHVKMPIKGERGVIPVLYVSYHNYLPMYTHWIQCNGAVPAG